MLNEFIDEWQFWTLSLLSCCQNQIKMTGGNLERIITLEIISVFLFYNWTNWGPCKYILDLGDYRKKKYEVKHRKSPTTGFLLWIWIYYANVKWIIRHLLTDKKIISPLLLWVQLPTKHSSVPKLSGLLNINVKHKYKMFIKSLKFEASEIHSTGIPSIY